MVSMFRKVTIVPPSLKDPRLIMSSVLIVYTFIGQVILSFDHDWTQILTSLIVACTLDTLLTLWKSRQLTVPLSGFITGLGLGLLVESIPLWPFIVAPILAICAKAVIRFQGRNIFNPSNFGLTVLLILAPGTVTTLAAQWSGSLIIVALVFIVGGITAYRVNRWDLVLSYMGGFAAMALIEEVIMHFGWAFVYGPMLGAAFQLFTLSMLTDPKTTPATRPMRILFGLTVAAIDGILRVMSIQNSPFIALFFVSAAVPILRLIDSIVRERLAARRSQGSVSLDVDLDLEESTATSTDVESAVSSV